MAVIAAGLIGSGLVLSCLSARLRAAAPSVQHELKTRLLSIRPAKILIKSLVSENQRVREINYVGVNSISSSEVLDRFKKDKVSLSLESEYDPTKTKKVEVVLKQLEAEDGYRSPTVRTKVRSVPPGTVGIRFVVSEGPKAF